MDLRLYWAPATSFPTVGYYRKSNSKRDLQSINDFKILEKEIYKETKVGDIIFLLIRTPYFFGGTYYGEYPRFFRKDKSFVSRENYFNDWISAVQNLAKNLDKNGGKIIIQTPTPEWERENNKFCSTVNEQWFNSMQVRNCQIKSSFFIDEDKGLYKHIFEKLNQLSTSQNNIYIFDVYKIVCPESTCNFTIDGNDIYRNDNHLSYEWARDVLSKRIYKFIKDITNKEFNN